MIHVLVWVPLSLVSPLLFSLPLPINFSTYCKNGASLSLHAIFRRERRFLQQFHPHLPQFALLHQPARHDGCLHLVRERKILEGCQPYWFAVSLRRYYSHLNGKEEGKTEGILGRKKRKRDINAQSRTDVIALDARKKTKQNPKRNQWPLDQLKSRISSA